uniref:Uncharacterized protein n=1 Tax=Arundo donax TaxID=35708 RepID=A0A0A8ZSY3_ARUDO
MLLSLPLKISLQLLCFAAMWNLAVTRIFVKFQ